MVVVVVVLGVVVVNGEGVNFGFEVVNENGLNVVNLNGLNGVKVDAVIGVLVVRLVVTGALAVGFSLVVVVVFIVVVVVVIDGDFVAFVGLVNGAKVGIVLFVVVSNFCSGTFLKQSSVCDDVV